MDVTIDQVRDLIKAEKMKPSDLFGAEILADDPSVRGLVESEIKRAVAGEYAHRKRTEEGFDKTKTEFEKKIQEQEAQLNNLKIETAKAKVRPIYDAQKTARKLTEKQAAFIEGRLDRFTPKKAEDVEKEFNTHLDSEIDEFGKVAKLLGIDDGKGKDDGKGQDGGTGPDETKKTGAPENKYIDPAQNPMIKIL